ncbi:RNA polymerase sigma-70 factor (ECF subfamily) [Thermosporothrix hazakensis]|jgi:RNA polymerase sigma-70 factor (ECF subfamily)|uniref:RNA polymerase sigma-70 factor (ECF subfamily) n=1 Tax=Thermosporothrix hazakensis TaxID=644383 RepID=A0A326U3P1_THEHA|nr:sigma-70 family RNA polymerase sigma factor [Thermosporothrix hazakensis]PZW18207.1 RNA polymerase sigma-70 factor (ECF subfamily) [Thermosporothrix hazakensis]GCE50327.1 DNA-directed RNA polymerase sigma-70 factor [Thermosporothrix hazakensis]
MRIFKPKKTASPEFDMRMLEELNDERLIEYIAGGVVWGLDVLYQRYHRLMYALAYRLVSDHQVAEDLLQEAFFAVWQYAKSYSAQSGKVRTWLFSILHHRAIDYVRYVQRRSHLGNVPLESAEQEPDICSEDAWEATWKHEQGTQVRNALMKLPVEQRMVIELAYFQGWTQAEIAEGCQIPLGTVKARMRLGLLHLRSYLQGMGMDE